MTVPTQPNDRRPGPPAGHSDLGDLDPDDLDQVSGEASRRFGAVRASWLDGSRPLARRVAQPIRSFLHIEASGGLLLLVATIVALVWANSPVRASYATVWHTDLVVGLGRWNFHMSLAHFVNDGLMAIFFFVIGLEIKHEWVDGELRDRRAAVLPIVAAVGGMVVPALIFLLFAGSTIGAHGWGIPMATDIAFVVGAMALLGSRVPGPLKVFLLALAIVDDLGAIVVIAVFYAGRLDWLWLSVALLGLAVVVGLRAVKVRWTPMYLAVGLIVWFATWQSGVHPTIAGVALAFLTPVTAFQPAEAAETIVDTLEGRDDLTVDDVRFVSGLITESVSPRDRLERALHPWSSYVIMPVFALANAGVALTTQLRGDGLQVAAGVMFGLVIGKFVGVAGASWVVVRLGIASKPDGVSWLQLLAGAALAGIGFTMSLFVTDLAFVATSESGVLATDAKLGVLIGSAVSAFCGVALMIASHRRSRRVAAVGDGPIAVGEVQLS